MTLHSIPRMPCLALPGRGVIIHRTRDLFDYNKIGDAYLKIWHAGSSSNLLPIHFWMKLTQYPVLAWASFDGSTNAPEVYPNGNSILNLQNQLLIQITPTFAGQWHGWGCTLYGGNFCHHRWFVQPVLLLVSLKSAAGFDGVLWWNALWHADTGRHL